MSPDVKPTDIAEVIAKRDAPHGWALLHSKLPSAAIKALSESVYGVAGLSDVNEGYLIQRLFAADLGWEWHIVKQEYLGFEDRAVRNKDYTNRYYLASVQGILTVDGRQFHGAGAHDNRKLDAAFKGAATVAFKNSCKLAGLTIELFKDGKAMDFIYEDRQGNASVPADISPSNGAGTAPSHPKPADSVAPSPTPSLQQAIDAAVAEDAAASTLTPEELGDIAELYRLGETLPKQPQSQTAVQALVMERGFEGAKKRLIYNHNLQCGTKCGHFKPVSVRSD